MSQQRKTTQQPIGSLSPGDSVESVYHLVKVEQRTKKNGDPYYSLQIGDATGQANAVIMPSSQAPSARMTSPS